ncbi:MAG: hypothetical protein H0V91_07710 [Flavisolibacter sp.]|jgi:hypothetical protein|nr:hypothetical protein [Flavisolibacter sp.]
MKQIILAITMSISSFIMTASANEIKSSPLAVSSFENSFPTAADIMWKEVGDFYQATFVLDGQILSAFYSEAGDFIAVTKNISFFDLPLNLQLNLKKDDTSWIKDIISVSTTSGNAYYLQIEKAGSTMIYKSFNNKKWVLHSVNDKF